jgi:hypothetical protein
MGKSSTERSQMYREKRRSGQVRERPIFANISDETYQLLADLVHQGGPFATMKSTLTRLIELHRPQP